MLTEKKLEELEIRPEFSSRIPPLLPKELEILEENILAEGSVINPIVVWGSVIVDGHNRYRILLKHPEISYSVFEKDFSNEDAALAWICRNQLGRRNLTPNQRKYLIGKQYSLEKLSFGGARNSKQETERPFYGGNKSSPQNEDLKQNERTCYRIARENHVGHAYVERAEKYADSLDEAEELSPGIRRQVLGGELKVTAKELDAVRKAADLQDKKERLDSIFNKPPKNKKEEINRIKEISEKMESGDISPKKEAGERYAREQSAIAELTDAWESFRIRWDLCFEMFIDDSIGERVQKRIRKLTSEGIRYLQEKEEEVDEINRTPVSGNHDQQPASGGAALQLPEGPEPGAGPEDCGGI